MLKKRTLAITLLVFVVLAVSVWAGASGSIVDQKGVLAGKVAAQGMVAVGSHVREGDILVRVETLTGALPAARATGDGIVREVLVKPGDVINVDQVVARVEMGRK